MIKFSYNNERAEEQMLKKWYAKLLVLLAVVCAVAAAHPAAQAEAIPEETAQTQAESDTAVQGAKMVASGTCGDNLTWSLDSAGTLTISGSGAMAYFFSTSDRPWKDYSESIRTIAVGAGVTSISAYSFYRFQNLTAITLPDSLTNIGASAFMYCKSLTGVILPDSLTSIGDSAFCGCTGLTSLTFPAGLTSIGDGTFSLCTGLTSLTLPDDLESVGNSTFSSCTGLTSLTLPDGLKSIGNSTFSGCTGLTSFMLPNSLSSIGKQTFRRCTGLTSLTLPNWLTSIGDGAFGDCTGLTSITFPNSLTSIDTSAFSGCTGLTSITFPNKLTSIGISAFSDCTSLTSITFPDSLTSIGTSAFSGCTGLTGITFPNSLTRIGVSAFSGCSSLADISFPKTLQSISSEAFYLCGFSKITVPASVTYIGPYGLYCSTDGGADIYFSGNAPTVTAADSEKPSFSTDSTLYFDLEKTGWTDSSCYDPSTGKWNGYKTSVAGDDLLAYGACGTNLRWKLYRNGKLSISGSGAMADYNYYESAAPWTGYSDSIYTVTVGAGVTSIGAYAFSYCGKITAVTLPASLTGIDESAFCGCTGLTGIAFPAGLTSIGASAFSGCSGLTGITLPAGLTGICDYVFERCTGLTSITLPAGLTSIGKSAFYSCTGLTGIELPDSLTSIGSSAFCDCTGLTDIKLPDSLTSIGSSAFSYCSALTSITLPAGLTSLAGGTFSYCTGLTGITLPASLTRIGYSAFYGCSSLTGITFPVGLTTIDDSAFQYCTGLTSIVCPDSLGSISYRAFQGCTGLTSVTFPAGLFLIGYDAFNGCTGLTGITLPKSLTYLGSGAFARTGITAFASESDKYTVDKSGAVYDTSNSLIAYPAGNPQTVYVIQAGTKTIEEEAFAGAAHLTAVMVPDSVEKIGNDAFYSMAELESVYFFGDAPSGSEEFERKAGRLKIYHAAGADGWTEENWPSQYFELIEWNPYAVTDVQLDAETLTLPLGKTQKLVATVLPEWAKDKSVTWASADMDVAAVFADGTVLGKKAGTTTVTATTADGGFTASCTVTVEPAPDGVMPVRLDSVCARPGNTVQVRLMLDENPGFANLSLVIGYDADVMTLTKVENKVSGTEYTGSQTLTAAPYMLTWNSGTQNCTASGTLAILTFQIKDTAAYGMYPISVSFYKGLQGTYKDGVNVNYDQSRNALPLVYVGSSAEIRSYIPGDISGDGRVDSRDVLNLLRHLSGWKGITVVEEALDVNGDGESDFRDVTALLQYIAGWDVVLH